MFKTLRLQLRFLLPLVATLVAAAYMAAPMFDSLISRWFSRDLTSRGMLVANALSDSIADAMVAGQSPRLRRLFERAVEDERLFAIGVCDLRGRVVQRTDRFPEGLSCAKATQLSLEQEPRLVLEGGAVHVAVHDVVDRRPPAPPAPPSGAEFGLSRADVQPGPATLADQQAAVAAAENQLGPVPSRVVGQLVLLHDLSFIERRSADTRRYLVFMITGLGLAIAFITMVVAQLSWRGWVQGARALMRGEMLLRPVDTAPELAPLAAELRGRLRDMEDEYRRSQGPEAEWTAERLRLLLKTQLSGDQVIVVSNREPYIHERTPEGIVVKRPASGLVTAVEPVMRACSGTWIAHGSGSADREVVDASDRVAVPPGHDDYWLRRIWLSEQEEQGYYYGFANEGMWPLCHVAHVRPVFRESDWECYRQVNQRVRLLENQRRSAIVEQARQ